MTTERVPEVVKLAVETFQAPAGFAIVPPKPGETSLIFSWGVRVVNTADEHHVSWVCLASHACRTNLQLYRLSQGRTSRATRHLGTVHQIGRQRRLVMTEGATNNGGTVPAENNPSGELNQNRPPLPPGSGWGEDAEEDDRRRKRRRQLTTAAEDAAALVAVSDADLLHADPVRLQVLLETLRVVQHHVPMDLGTLRGSRLLDVATSGATGRAPVVVDGATIAHTLVELQQTVRIELTGLLEQILSSTRRGRAFPAATLLLDVSPGANDWGGENRNRNRNRNAVEWTRRSTRWIALRLCVVDADFAPRTMCLGVRHWDETDVGDPRAGLVGWIHQVLAEFRLSRDDLVAVMTATNDHDAQWLLRWGLQLPWAPSLPHLVDAATARACGMLEGGAFADDEGASHHHPHPNTNPLVTALLARVVVVLHDVRNVDALGSDFASMIEVFHRRRPWELRRSRACRLHGICRILRRIVDKWGVIADWYEARATQDVASNVVFPLAEDRETMIQLISLLEPLTGVYARSHGDHSSQVEVFLTLCSLRRTALNCKTPLRDCRSTREKEIFFPDTRLTPTVRTTRHLLAAEFHAAFFRRYVDPQMIPEQSWIYEMQMILHPHFKRSLDGGFREIVLMANMDTHGSHATADANFSLIKNSIMQRMRSIMMQVSFQSGPTAESANRTAAQCPQAVTYSDDIENMTRPPSLVQQAEDLLTPRHEHLFMQELNTWFSDTCSLNVDAHGHPESVLAYWRRRTTENMYPTLPRVARVLFSIPATAARLDRDFDVARATVETQRSSVAPYDLDLCAFLNCNSEYIDIGQCIQVPQDQRADHIPRSALVNLASSEREQMLVASLLERAESVALDSVE